MKRAMTTGSSNGRGAAVYLKEILKVDAVSNKFGNGSILVNEEWMSLNDGVNLADISKGETYEFEIKVGSNGKRYVNKILSLQEEAVQEEQPKQENKGTDEVPTQRAVRVSKGAELGLTGKKAEFRSADEIKRSSGVGIAANVEAALIHSGQEFNQDRMFSLADTITKYIVTGTSE